MEFIDHYKVLGLPSGEVGKRLNTIEITKAYKAKALKVHPDKRLNDPNANAEFQTLRASYEVLIDPQGRKRFHSSFLASSFTVQQKKDTSYTAQPNVQRKQGASSATAQPNGQRKQGASSSTAQPNEQRKQGASSSTAQPNGERKQGASSSTAQPNGQGTSTVQENEDDIEFHENVLYLLGQLIFVFGPMAIPKARTKLWWATSFLCFDYAFEELRRRQKLEEIWSTMVRVGDSFKPKPPQAPNN